MSKIKNTGMIMSDYYLKFGEENNSIHKQPYVLWDILAFRPDPKILLTKNKFYPVQVELKNVKRITSKEAVLIPRKIQVLIEGKNVTFVNIRCP